jgi:hypothetical protein
MSSRLIKNLKIPISKLKSIACNGTYLLLNYKFKHNEKKLLSLFYRKKVVIIGPGEQITNELKLKILESDVCIIIKHLYSVINPNSELFSNTRLIISHTLRMPDRGYLKKSEIKNKNYSEVLFPFANDGFNCDLMRFSLSGNEDLNLYRASSKDYLTIKKSIDGFMPSTAYATIFLTQIYKPADLHIHGLTFYRNKGPFHIDGYRKAEISDNEILKHIKDTGNHSPENEFNSFLKLMSKKNISTSGILREIIESL